MRLVPRAEAGGRARVRQLRQRAVLGQHGLPVQQLRAGLRVRRERAGPGRQHGAAAGVVALGGHVRARVDHEQVRAGRRRGGAVRGLAHVALRVVRAPAAGARAVHLVRPRAEPHRPRLLVREAARQLGVPRHRRRPGADGGDGAAHQPRAGARRAALRGAESGAGPHHVARRPELRAFARAQLPGPLAAAVRHGRGRAHRAGPAAARAPHGRQAAGAQLHVPREQRLRATRGAARRVVAGGAFEGGERRGRASRRCP